MGDERLILSDYADYTKLFDALSHPMRFKILGILSENRKYISELAKQINISRPLLYMHLKKLEDAAIVTSSYEISETGKSLKYYEVKTFDIRLTNESLVALSQAIPTETVSNK